MKELVYGRLLLPAAENYALEVAFVEHETGQSERLGEHVERSIRLASALRRELGMQSGRRFGVLAGNSRHYVNLWHAALLGGGVITPMNTRSSESEIVAMFADSETEVVFTDAEHAPAVERMRAGLPKLRRVVLIGQADVPHDVGYDTLVEAGDPSAPPEPEEGDPAVLLYTGGTTGRPKGVLHTQRAQTLNVYRMGIMLECFSRRCTYLQATPMFHSGGGMGTLTIPVSGGTTVILQRFDPAAAIAAIEHHRITVTGLVPTMLGMIVNHPEFRPERLSSLRRVAYGSSPMPIGLLRRLLDELPELDLVQTYGLTEASAVLTFLTPDDHRRGDPICGSAGRSLPGVRIAIQDSSGNSVEARRLGEVCARSGSFMQEYLNRPEETASAFRDGWFRTGDVGYLDEKGYLFLVDRAKDMIVTGGENVYSTEVESAISTHPSVAQVAVIGIPDERWGEAVHAIVVCKPGVETTPADIIAHARRSLAGYKVPKSVEFRTEPLPLSGAMKVLKRELRAVRWRGRDRAIG